MSTPMFDLPEHLRMGVTVDGRGPVCEDEPEFDHWACWCGDPDCPHGQVVWEGRTLDGTVIRVIDDENALPGG